MGGLGIRSRAKKQMRKAFAPQMVRWTLEQLADPQQPLTIVQIGAHVGATGNDPLHPFLQTHFQGSQVPKHWRVLLVEPVGYLFQQLVANYQGYANLEFENAAIADSDGEREFYALRADANPEKVGLPERMNQLGSLLPERMTTMWDNYERNPTIKQFFQANRVVEVVQCLTLQSLLEKHGLDRIDFLQMDVEGYEYEIFSVFPFERYKPTFINYERVLLFEREPACRALLSKHGYVLFDHVLDTLAIQDSQLASGLEWKHRLARTWLSLSR